MSDKIYDLTIVGGGPVGIYAAFYAGMQGLEVKLIDTLEHLGGQLTAIYPEKYIYDLPGHLKIRASDMIEQLKNQMNQYKERIEISTSTTVVGVVKQEDNKFEVTTTVDKFISRAVLITAGNGAFNPRKLDLKSEDAINLHYFVTDMMQFKDKEIVIFGGGDSAVDWALMLNGVAKKVTLVHRREDFRAHESQVEKLKKSDVEIKTSCKALELLGNNEKISGVILEHLETNEQIQLDVDDVIVLFGFVSSLGPIKDWGLELRRTALTVDTMDQTNITGIFAAGDAATFDGKIKMITTGFGEAVVAINAAKAYAYPDKVQRHQHSSAIAHK